LCKYLQWSCSKLINTNRTKKSQMLASIYEWTSNWSSLYTHNSWYLFFNSNHIYIILLVIEHAANCLTHGVLIIPAFIATQWLISRANTLEEYWSSIIYGNALILLFSFSTVFHCSCFHPTYRYNSHLNYLSNKNIIYL